MVSKIWEDRDFDYGYLLDILEFKLQRMELFFNGTEIHCVEAYECADQIRAVLDLLKRRKDCDYYDEAGYARLDEKWGKFTAIPTEKGSILSRTNVHTDEDKDEERADTKEILDEACLLEEQDWNEIFHLLRKNLRNWWD